MNSAASRVMVLIRSRPSNPEVFPLEGDAGLVERDQPGVRERGAVGVAGKIDADCLRGLANVSWRGRPLRRKSEGEEG